MKRLGLFIIGLLCLVSCQKSEDPSYSVVGTWELVSVETKSAKVGSVTVDVILTLEEDNTFTIEQSIGEGRSSEFSGTYTYSGGVLSGKYSDGTVWGDKYTVEVTQTTMSLTSSSGQETDTYKRR